MKTYFAEPAVEVIKFNTEDVITASGEVVEEEEIPDMAMIPPCG